MEPVVVFPQDYCYVVNISTSLNVLGDGNSARSHSLHLDADGEADLFRSGKCVGVHFTMFNVSSIIFEYQNGS